MTAKEMNQIIKFVKTNDSHISFPTLDLPSSNAMIYLDATFNNLPNGHSQASGT